MIQQYLQIKQQYKDSILFFRMGDFYEMFFEDAVSASKILEITLTARDGGAGKKVPMCGVPHHAAENYIARLISKGCKVAICEQVEDPREVKGLVKREVIRVITPGTVIEGQCLEDKHNNYLASVLYENGSLGLAYTDVSTGLFMLTEYTGENAVSEILDEIFRLQPSEFLVPSSGSSFIEKYLGQNKNAIITTINDELYKYESCLALIKAQFGANWGSNEESVNLKLGVRAAGAILFYLQETQKRTLQQLAAPKVYFSSQYLKIDCSSRRNLELTKSIKDGTRWGTLIWVLDYTSTAMGGRLLKLWIEQPLVNVKEINTRLDAVEELLQNLLLRKKIKDFLKDVYDLERLASKVSYGTANARDMLALKKSFSLLPAIKMALSNCVTELLVKLAKSMDEMKDLMDVLSQAIADEPPVSVRDGGIIRDGYHPEVDRLREASRNGKDWLARIESEEREKTGIRTLKVGYNKVFGYYLEVTKSNLDLVPEYYTRRQTLVNAERYITPQLKEYEELIMGAEDRLTQLEYDLFSELRQKVCKEVPRIQQLANILAVLDVLISLAEAAQNLNYVRPLVNKSNRIIINEGRHPVVERVMDPGGFVPNETILDQQHRLILLTGPNMAGKSTYMRQVALITLMAQAGSFVPASSAEIGIVDQIFTRIGAADDLAGGRSTFMVEMSECTEIVKKATPLSLIIMDEVGRGTSTYDGISIARALVEYINNAIKARTLFSTHYHELTDLEELPGICNYTIDVREKDEEIIFLRKVLPGKVDRSYGIQVAKLAGLPESILNRAKNFLIELEKKKTNISSELDPVFFAEQEKKVCENCLSKAISGELSQIDPARITPIEALNLLALWKEKLDHQSGIENKLLKDINIFPKK
ncbi:DNA mismatch repair protein MutS [Desulfotruncus alcoholivorax]|uniref:DNA mismatch repair protein MutS n=1 Tax=Desulfotruncus alcoholivorax TaxID=265477 RepID=UPI00068430ED